jgi:hypothetical protein
MKIKMKKFILITGLFTVIVSASHGQELGLRFGDISGGNVAVDGIFSTSKYSRIHADVSFGNGVGVDLIWDFLYRPLGSEAFDWYVGAGPYTFIGDPFQLGVVGEVGLEYHFNGVPLAIGGDWRPVFRLIDNTDLFWGGFGFNVRWVFGG